LMRCCFSMTHASGRGLVPPAGKKSNSSRTPPAALLRGNCRQTARASGPRRIPGKAEYSSEQGVASRRWPFLRPQCRLSGMIVTRFPEERFPEERCIGSGTMVNPVVSTASRKLHGMAGKGRVIQAGHPERPEKPINTKCPLSQKTYFLRIFRGLAAQNEKKPLEPIGRKPLPP
jgi:hypothetical protein